MTIQEQQNATIISGNLPSNLALHLCQLDGDAIETGFILCNEVSVLYKMGWQRLLRFRVGESAFVETILGELARILSGKQI